MNFIESIPSSFRDPSGNLFFYKGTIYRRVSHIYRDHYELLMKSGLYNELAENGLMVKHDEVKKEDLSIEDTYKILRPEKVDFISYPYEWCFSQLKDAALLTLEIQKTSLKYGMSLKDASAYNVQFNGYKPVFIDTLSFERYREGEPWVAYRQFCQHFLAPLSLMSLKDIRLSELLRVYIDGIPLDLANILLPFRTRFNMGVLFHMHLHAKSQKRFENKKINKKKLKMGIDSFKALMESLQSCIENFKWKPKGTQWSDYYEISNYSEKAIEHKSKIVLEIMEKIDPKIVLDIGANDGFFSRLISKKADFVISIDADYACVEKNYLECKKNNFKNILPLLIDITNPSPPIGWENMERASFFHRFRPNTVLALALIHHLAISHNLPLERIASFFHEICRFLIIEFVPKTDVQTIRLLSTREDIFFEYTQDVFERVFSKYFHIRERSNIVDTERTIYFMERTDG